MYFTQKTITPEIATQMLSANVHNRRLNAKRIQTLMSDMKNGNWTESPQPICFDTQNKLIDGQHRLSAVVRSGVPVVMTVAYDVPRNAVLDKGLERSTGDALFMRGVISIEMSKRDAQAVVNRYLSITNGASRANTMSDTSKIEFINRNEELISKAISISRLGNKRDTICKRAGIQAAILGALMEGVSEEKLTSFARVVNSGFMESPEQSSAVVLRNYALEHPTTGEAAANKLCACAEMAIRDFVSGTPRRQKYRRKFHIYIKAAEPEVEEDKE